MSGTGQTMDEIKDDPIFTTPTQATRRRSPYAARDLSDSVDGARRSWWVHACMYVCIYVHAYSEITTRTAILIVVSHGYESAFNGF